MTIFKADLFSASSCHRDAEADEQFGAVVVVGAGGSSAVCPAEARRHSESLRQADTRGRFQLLANINLLFVFVFLVSSEKQMLC